MRQSDLFETLSMRRPMKGGQRIARLFLDKLCFGLAIYLG